MSDDLQCQACGSPLPGLDEECPVCWERVRQADRLREAEVGGYRTTLTDRPQLVTQLGTLFIGAGIALAFGAIAWLFRLPERIPSYQVYSWTFWTWPKVVTWEILACALAVGAIVSGNSLLDLRAWSRAASKTIALLFLALSLGFSALFFLQLLSGATDQALNAVEVQTTGTVVAIAIVVACVAAGSVLILLLHKPIIEEALKAEAAAWEALAGCPAGWHPELPVDPQLAERLRAGKRYHYCRTLWYGFGAALSTALAFLFVWWLTWDDSHRWFRILGSATYFLFAIKQWLLIWTSHLQLTDAELVFTNRWLRTQRVSLDGVLAVRAHSNSIAVSRQRPDAKGKARWFRIYAGNQEEIVRALAAELIGRCALVEVRPSPRATIWQRAQA